MSAVANSNKPGAELNEQNPSPRRAICARCGTAFECGLGGDCWCAAEPYRLRMPVEGEDCLCRNCLRKAAPGAA